MSFPPIPPPPARPELPEGVQPSAAPPGWVPPRPPAPPAPHGVFGHVPAWPWWAPSIIAGLFLLLVAFAVAAGGGEAGADEPSLPTTTIVVGTIIQDAFLIGFSWLLAWATAGRMTPASFGLRPTAVMPAVGWTLAMLVGFMVFSVIWSVAAGIDENDDLALDLGADESTGKLLAVALMVTVAAPIAEEFFFRGFFFPALWRAVGLWPAAALNGIVFGLIHAGGTDVGFLVPLAVFGFGLCLLYRLTRSLLPCIALHSINNALALGVTLKWEWWEVLIAVATAPAVVLLLVIPLSRPAPPEPA